MSLICNPIILQQGYPNIRKLIYKKRQSQLTLARLISSSCPALMFSFLPPHARNTEACNARPYEKVRAHGRTNGTLLMEFKLTEASSSVCPPDKKVTPK